MNGLVNRDSLQASERTVGRIPVKNLWLLMLYASDLYRTQGYSRTASEAMPDELPRMVGEILVKAVEARLRRNLGFGYQHREQILNRVRGRIDVLTTERKQLMMRGQIACRFDELTPDTMRNRFVRLALEKVSGLLYQHPEGRRCRQLAQRLAEMGVSKNGVIRSQIDLDRFGAHDSADRLMVSAAKLAYDMALPNESEGKHFMHQPERDEVWVRRLFEKAVAGFYRVALEDDWVVRSGVKLRWFSSDRTPGLNSVFPQMTTDVILENLDLGQRLVIDTKFTSIYTKSNYREKTLRSGYLYQIYAYLRSQVDDSDPIARLASGLLLHPAIGETVDESVVIQGHYIRFATVDLAASSREIRDQLMKMIMPDPRCTS